MFQREWGVVEGKGDVEGKRDVKGKSDIEGKGDVEGSDEQGFGNPCGYMGKGTAGMGRGKNLWTLAKPLPSAQVMGYPHSSSAGHVPPTPPL